MLQLDDFDIADHLEDPGSRLAKHFCRQDGLGEGLMLAAHSLDERPWGGWLRTKADLFWDLVDGELVALKLKNAYLVDGSIRAGYRI